MAFGKRKLTSYGMRRSNKRSRTNFRRRRFNRSRRGNVRSWTTQTGGGNTLKYRSRKMRSGAFRRHLWNKTLADTHYRSTGNGVFAPTTGVVVGVGSVTEFNPCFIGVPGPTTAFYTAAGGLITSDTGASVPTFPGGDFVIRGGQIGITVMAPDTVTDDINVKIFTVALKERPDRTKLPATLFYGSMIDVNPEFVQEYGKIIDVKEATVNYQSPAITVCRRLKVQKVDRETFGTRIGSQLAFILVITNMIDATSNAVSAVVWHDLSFTGDAVEGTV